MTDRDDQNRTAGHTAQNAGRHVATPRPSASVMIVRDGRDGIEVFMIRRSPALDFSPNNLVFPGGAVDPADELPQRLADYDRGELLVFQLAALREAFEESGFLFADRQDLPLAALARARESLLRGDGHFYQQIASCGITLRPDLLQPVSHWVTPVQLRRRFSTYFFLARQPSGQQGSHDGGEAVDSGWFSVAALLAMCDSEDPSIMLPTEMNCRWLAGFASSAAALAAAAAPRRIPSVTPRVERRGDSYWLLLPADSGYGALERKLR